MMWDDRPAGMGAEQVKASPKSPEASGTRLHEGTEGTRTRCLRAKLALWGSTAEKIQRRIIFGTKFTGAELLKLHGKYVQTNTKTSNAKQGRPGPGYSPGGLGNDRDAGIAAL